MNDSQKEAFTRATRGLAHELLDDLSAEVCTTADIERLGSKMVEGIMSIYDINSTTYLKKVNVQQALWFNADVRKQRKTFRAAKHLFDHSRNCPVKRTEWKKQEGILKVVIEKAKKDLHEGNMNKVVTQEEMSKLTKFAKTGTVREIGLLKTATGKTSKSPEESLGILCDAHFQGSRRINESNITESKNRAFAEKGAITKTDFEWNTVERLSKAINSFSNGKAPGMDGITPELMKLLSEEFILALKYLYDMMLSLKYTPTSLRTSKVTMIAKAGKSDYAQPKSFRPISLTPFFFKLLERICAWDICDTALRSNPIHKRQHAYRMGRSTESAIAQTLNEIDKELEKGHLYWLPLSISRLLLTD